MPFPEGFTTLIEDLDIFSPPGAAGYIVTSGDEQLDPAYLQGISSPGGGADVYLASFTIVGDTPPDPDEPCCPEVPEPEVAAPCPPPRVYMGSPCHAPDCIQQWEDGPAMWDGGGTWWDCEPVDCLYSYWRVRRLQPDGDDYFMSLHYLTFLDGAEGELVPQPPVGAIGMGDPEAAFTFGGPMWEAFGEGVWVGYRFEAPVRPAFVGFLAGWSSEFPTEFAVEASQDGVAWTLIGQYSESGYPDEYDALVYPIVDCDGNVPSLPENAG